MYSRKAWGGDIDPFILTKFVKAEDDIADQDALVSLVIFEWGDEALIGRQVPGTDVWDNDLQLLRARANRRIGASYHL